MKTKAWVDLNDNKVYEGQTNLKLDQLSTTELLSEDQLPHDFEYQGEGVDGSKVLFNLTYEEDDGLFKLGKIEAYNHMYEFAEGGVTKESVEERRKFLDLKNGPKTRSKTIIARAQLSNISKIKEMDYVIKLDGPVNPASIERIIKSNHEFDDLTKPRDKKLKWVSDHAQSMSVTRGIDHSVFTALVDAKDVVEASNTGEFLYVGSEPASTIELIVSDENGMLDKPESEKRHDNESTMSY